MKSSGVTIAELLISLAIVGVLAGMGFYFSRNFSRQQVLNQAVLQVKKDLRAMQNKAVSSVEGSRWGLYAEKDKAYYKIGPHDGSGFVNPLTVDLPGQGSVTFSSSSTTIIFEKLTGSPLAGTATLTVSSSLGVKSVKVSPGGKIAEE